MKFLARYISLSLLVACALNCLGAQPTSPASTAALSAGTIRELLKAHNDVRAHRQIPPLQWSPRLADAAQAWAERLSAMGALQHDRTRRVGQNLFVSYNEAKRPSFVVGKWAEESQSYDERRFRCATGEVCGHFTQIIWRSTKQVGCGVADGKNGEFWVCFYSPPGNFVGEKPY